MVLLKPLAAARAAGDRVYAVIRAGAAGHPGRLEAVPHHARLVGRALAASGLPLPAAAPGPDGPGAVVAGAGPEALGIAVRESVRTAAGLAGERGVVAGAAALARAVGQLRHATLLPGPGRAAPVAWEPARRDDGTPVPRRALVGVSGPPAADAVLVVEEAPRAHRPPARPDPARPARHPAPAELVLLSAATPRQLAATAAQLARWLTGAARHGGPAGADLAAVAHELRLGRAPLRCRLAVVAHTVTGLAAQLAAFAEPAGPAGAGRHPAGVRSADLRDVGEPLLLDTLAETRAYMAALWQGGRLEQLTRLWLAGADICAVLPAHPGPEGIELPPTVLQPQSQPQPRPQPRPQSQSGPGPQLEPEPEPEPVSVPEPESLSEVLSQPGSQSGSRTDSRADSRSSVPLRSQHGPAARPVESQPGTAVPGTAVSGVGVPVSDGGTDGARR
ncbi:hypothetical protein ACFW9X_41320 [Streptomyces sp. NPDC059466]|uniref:KS-MAT linker domain-containing protein n=1 Tax=Streptomyces sp. NPDC059466 TaxID=3346843 RepID=UPI0036AF04E9